MRTSVDSQRRCPQRQQALAVALPPDLLVTTPADRPIGDSACPAIRLDPRQQSGGGVLVGVDGNLEQAAAMSGELGGGAAGGDTGTGGAHPMLPSEVCKGPAAIARAPVVAAGRAMALPRRPPPRRRDEESAVSAAVNPAPKWWVAEAEAREADARSGSWAGALGACTFTISPPEPPPDPVPGAGGSATCSVLPAALPGRTSGSWHSRI